MNSLKRIIFDILLDYYLGRYHKFLFFKESCGNVCCCTVVSGQTLIKNKYINLLFAGAYWAIQLKLRDFEGNSD